MRSSLLQFMVMLVIPLSFGSAAEAAVCASTLGQASTYTGGGFSINGSGTGGTRFDQAHSFTTGFDCRLGAVELAMSLTGGINGLRVTVVEDSGGQPGLTVVESTTIIDQMTTDPAGSIVTGVFSGANVLSGSSTYWIVLEAEPPTGNTLAAWHLNDLGLIGVPMFRMDEGEWIEYLPTTVAAFRITEGGVPVSVMSPWGLRLLAAALLLSSSLLLITGPRRANPAR